MNIKWVIGLIVAVVVFVGGYALARQGANNKTMSQEEAGNMVKPEGSMMASETKPESMVQNEPKQEGMMEEKQPETGGENKMEKKPGAYKDFSPQALAEATKDGGKAVLFFWASWCPYCKTANEDFLNNASGIPQNVTVLKANYDAEKDLKTKYGITYQHTFVQVDASGSQITKWSGGGVKELTSNIK